MTDSMKEYLGGILMLVIYFKICPNQSRVIHTRQIRDEANGETYPGKMRVGGICGLCIILSTVHNIFNFTISY